MPKRPIVCDTTVLLYLGRIDQIDMLSALYDPIWVPESVRLELDMGRLLRRDTVDPRSLPWALPLSVPQVMIDALPPNRLGPGEQAVIAYANAHQGTVAGLDDLRARQTSRLGYCRTSTRRLGRCTRVPRKFRPVPGRAGTGW